MGIFGKKANHYRDEKKKKDDRQVMSYEELPLDEYEKEVQRLATTYGSSDANTFVSEYESVYGEGYIRSELLKSKVAAFLLDNCKYKESK